MKRENVVYRVHAVIHNEQSDWINDLFEEELLAPLRIYY